MEDDTQAQWEAFLNPDTTRRRLMATSIFITAFEFATGRIVDGVRGFFGLGIVEPGDGASRQYVSEVLVLDNNPVSASLKWLKSMSAITDEDIDAFHRLRKSRNLLAHEMFEQLTQATMSVNAVALYDELVALLDKIETWWILEVEVAAMPWLDGVELRKSEIEPGPILGLQLLREIAMGDRERSLELLRRVLSASAPQQLN